MQNGNGSPHLGQIEGILNSGVLSFLALADCSGETVSATDRAASHSVAAIRDSVLDVVVRQNFTETQDGAVLGGVGRRLSVRYSKKALEGANPRARGAHI